MTVARPAKRPAATVAVEARNPPCCVAPVSAPPAATRAATRNVPGESRRRRSRPEGRARTRQRDNRRGQHAGAATQVSGRVQSSGSSGGTTAPRPDADRDELVVGFGFGSGRGSAARRRRHAGRPRRSGWLRHAGHVASRKPRIRAPSSRTSPPACPRERRIGFAEAERGRASQLGHRGRRVQVVVHRRQESVAVLGTSGSSAPGSARAGAAARSPSHAARPRAGARRPTAERLQTASS